VSKCYSMVNQGQRNHLDHYSTPLSLVWLYWDYLKDFLSPSKTILEPCGGSGAIVKALTSLDSNLNITFRDILETGDNFYECIDKFDLLITNPPYDQTNRFIAKCKEVSDEFFLLLPITHLQGQHRFFNQTYKGLKMIHLFTRMPMFEKGYREDGKFSTGMQTAAWFHFDKNYTGKPTLDWINNSKYVLKKADFV
jgi:type I restriction-modification system DNA methylase subunit